MAYVLRVDDGEHDRCIWFDTLLWISFWNPFWKCARTLLAKSEPVMICYMCNLNIFIDHRGFQTEEKKQINKWIDKCRFVPPIWCWLLLQWIGLGFQNVNTFSLKSNRFANWNPSNWLSNFKRLTQQNIIDLINLLNHLKNKIPCWLQMAHKIAKCSPINIL